MSNDSYYLDELKKTRAKCARLRKQIRELEDLYIYEKSMRQSYELTEEFRAELHEITYGELDWESS